MLTGMSNLMFSWSSSTVNMTTLDSAACAAWWLVGVGVVGLAAQQEVDDVLRLAEVEVIVTWQ